MVDAKRHVEAMDKLAALVSVRERCERESRRRLERCGFTPEEVDDAVDTALRCGLVSDERYARAFIRGKTHCGWGRNKITARLAAEGISEELVAACEDEFATPEAEHARALAELAKRPARSSNPYATLMRRLVGKGYTHDISDRAVREHLSRCG